MPMLRVALLLGLLLSSASVLGQVAPGLQGLGRCADRNGANDVNEGTLSVPAVPSGGQGIPFETAIRFTLSQPLTLEGAEILLTNSGLFPGISPFGTLQLYDENPGTGLPGAQIAQTNNVTSATALPNGLAWTGASFNPGVALNANTPYWISYFDLLGFGTLFATQNQTGVDTTPFSIGSPLGGQPFGPVVTNERLKLRLLSASCPQPTTASVVPVGVACPVGSGPALQTVGLPVVGNANFAFLANGNLANLPAALFWAPTADPVGTVVATGNCRLFLDLPATLNLVSAGLNPVATATTGLTGIASFPFPIPADPALDGFSAAFQAVLVDPTGAPTATPGLRIALTPAAVATIGL